MELKAMLGCKLFKETEDGDLDIIRISKLRRRRDGSVSPEQIQITHENNGEIEKVKLEDLKGYTTLEPDGILTFNVVNISDSNGKPVKDIIVTVIKMTDVKLNLTSLPFAICRQNITDVFYNLLVNDEKEMIVGLAVNKNNCPANFEYPVMLACNDIEFSTVVNIYRIDTLEDIYPLVPMLRYDDVLYNLYMSHIKSIGKPELCMNNEHKGWCKNLKTLLKENAFQSDINEMFGIADVDFSIKDYEVEKELPNGVPYTSLTDELKEWFSAMYSININDITSLEYNHDINLGDFNNAKYFMIRDKNKKLYMMVFTSEGEYHEADLEANKEKKDFSTQFRMNFYSKYNQINNT